MTIPQTDDIPSRLSMRIFGRCGDVSRQQERRAVRKCHAFVVDLKLCACQRKACLNVFRNRPETKHLARFLVDPHLALIRWGHHLTPHVQTPQRKVLLRDLVSKHPRGVLTQCARARELESRLILAVEDRTEIIAAELPRRPKSGGLRDLRRYRFAVHLDIAVGFIAVFISHRRRNQIGKGTAAAGIARGGLFADKVRHLHRHADGVFANPAQRAGVRNISREPCAAAGSDLSGRQTAKAQDENQRQWEGHTHTNV